MRLPFRMAEQFIENNVEFERKWHHFERFVWVALVLLLTAVCLGYFGQGPAAKRTAVASDGSLTIAYDRVLRTHSQSDVELILETSAVQQNEVQVRLAGAWTSSVPVQQMTPPASASSASRDSATYTFRADPGKPARIRLVQRPSVPGRFRSTASVPGQADVVIEQIVLP